MAVDTAQLVDYSWSDIAKAAKQAMMGAALGGANFSINGRMLGRITIQDAKTLYELAQQNIADESDTGGGIAIVRVGEPI